MSDEKLTQPKPFDALNARGLAAKREYVRGLEQRRDAEALSLLLECLCDESWYLRDLAGQVFQRMGDEGATAILPLLETGLWYTRTSVAEILGRLGFRQAVPALLRQADDANRTVAESARVALVSIARGGGCYRLAHVLHRMPPDARRRRFEDLHARDRTLAERIERLMRNEELMSAEDQGALADDSPFVRANEDGVEWELLTRPMPPPTGDVPGSGGYGSRPNA